MPTTSPPILIWQPEGGVPPTTSLPPKPPITNASLTQLVNGQDWIDVTFDTEQVDNTWIFLDCSVLNTTDPTPLNIWPGIITAKTSTGFRLYLNGLPDSNNYFLNWAISGVNIPPSPPIVATTYTLTGPATGDKSIASLPFTLKLPTGGTVASPVTVTPDDGGGGGTFTPATVTLTTAAPTATFTYTPASYGAKTISTTNDGSLTDPGSLTYSVVASTYTLTGPSSGAVSTPSTNFTVALPVGGAVSGTVTVTPSDSGAGGTFTPTTVALTTAAPSATFTYTPVSSGAKTISVTNNGGLTNPGNLSYVVAAPFSPSDIAGLLAWWKTDSITGLSHADPISSWADSSGHGHTATNSGSARPLYITNVTGAGAYFGAGTSLNIASPFSGGSGPWTIIAVMGNAGGDVYSLSSSGNPGSLAPSISGGIAELKAGNVFTDGTVSNPATVPNVVTGRTNGATTEIWVNGVSQSVTNGGSAGATGTFNLMGVSGVSSSNAWFSEILVYDSLLSTTDRTNAENYLRTKYGTP